MTNNKTLSSSAAAELPLLTVAVSSRALFDFEEENEIFKARGEKEYIRTQRERLNKIPAPGVAFELVKKLLAFNKTHELVRVTVVSRNDPVTGLRVFRAIADNRLLIEQGCFTRGAPSFPYLQPLGVHLFLSAFADDVKNALDNGVPAAHVVGGARDNSGCDGVLRIAFDGDAVLFGDESERVNREHGLAAFRELEAKMKNEPLSAGPLRPFLEALKRLQKQLGDDGERIRIALVTARGAPAHERPIRTLMEWGISVDEAFFMNGESKKEVVMRFGADFFFDDNIRYVDGLQQAGHVPSGIMNE